MFATRAARTVVGTEVGYQPSVLKPVVERVLASVLISFVDCIAQLFFNKNFPLEGSCAKQLKVRIVNKLIEKTIRVFIVKFKIVKEKPDLNNKVSQIY